MSSYQPSAKSRFRKPKKTRKPKKSDYSKKLVINKGKFLDKKINSAIEIKMKEIAESVLDANKQMGCHRLFPWGDYNAATGLYSQLEAISYNGDIREIGAIPKGGFDGTDFSDYDSKRERTSNVGVITGFNVSIHALVPESTTIPSRQESILRWSIVKVYNDYLDAVQPNDPEPDEALTMYRFGYSRILDTVPSPQEDSIQRITTLASGQIILKNSDIFPVDRNINEFIKLKKPLKIEFQKTALTHTRPVKWKLFMAVRSNIPQTDITNIKPQIAVCTKTYFYSA